MIISHNHCQSSPLGDRPLLPVQQQFGGGFHSRNGGLHEPARTLQRSAQARNNLQVQGACPHHQITKISSNIKSLFCNNNDQVRAYTAGDKFSETAWSQRISTDPDNTAILVGITVPIIILVLVLLAFVVLRKLHCAPCAKSGGHHGVGRDHPADLVSLPDSVIETSRPVKLKDFAEHYRIMSADSDFRFSEEYEEFKHVGRDQLCAAADLPVNRPKNRFSFNIVYF